MAKILSLFTLLSCTLSLWGQNVQFEEYYQQYTDNVDVNDSIAEKYLNLAIEELEEDYTKGLKPGNLFYAKAYDEYAEGNYKQALNNFFSAKDNFAVIQDSCKLKGIYFNLGCVISSLGDNESAIRYFNESQAIACDSSGTSDVLFYYNMGLVFSSLDLHEDAIKQFKLGLKSESLDEYDELNKYLIKMALCYEQHKLGEHKRAIKGHLRTLNDSNAIKFHEDILFYLYSELAQFYMADFQLDSAEHYILLAEKLEFKDFAKEFELINLLNRIEYHTKVDQFSIAEQKGETALNIANELGNFERILKAERLMAELYEKNGNYKAALVHNKKVKTIIDSLHIEKIKFAHLINEIEQSEAKMQQLESEMLRSQIELNKTNHTIIKLILALVLGGLFIYVLVTGNKKRVVLNEKLATSNKHKDKIITTLTHDIRSPLADVENILELMKMDALSYEDRSEIIKSINDRLDDLRGNVDSILKWSINQIKGANANREAVDVKEVVLKAVSYVSTRASDSNLLIDTESVGSDLIAFVDQSQLEIIIRNIISNAVKFSDYGEKIVVRAFAQDETIVISVQDFGVGIEKSEFDKILGDEIYTKDDTKFGVGIGLKLSKEYLSVNKGKMFLESVYGEGSTFIIHIPKFRN